MTTAAVPAWARAVGAVRRAVTTSWPLPRGRDRVSDLLLAALGDHSHRMPARTRFGATMQCDLRDLVQARIHQFGVWEPNLTAFISSRLTRGDVFVDVGANVGYFSLLASTLVGSTGKVVSIDASPRIYERLRGELSRNGANNVRTVNAAVSDRRGKLQVYLGADDNLGRTSVLAERGGTLEAEVDALPLLDILEPDELARTKLVKIDVEGAEGPVLGHIIQNLDALPKAAEIVVEVSPDAMAGSEWPIARVLAEFSARGYAWYTLENHYDMTDYVAPAPRRPERGRSTPTEQVDLVFSRTDAPTLG